MAHESVTPEELATVILRSLKRMNRTAFIQGMVNDAGIDGTFDLTVTASDVLKFLGERSHRPSETPGRTPTGPE